MTNKITVRWRSLYRKTTGDYAETLHAVPIDGTTAVCGSIARGVDGKNWMDPVQGMRRHKECETRLQKIIHSGWCPIAGKVRFDTELDANMVLTNAKMLAALRHSNKRRENRYYPCNHCHGFHVTSQGG